MLLKSVIGAVFRSLVLSVFVVSGSVAWAQGEAATPNADAEMTVPPLLSPQDLQSLMETGDLQVMDIRNPSALNWNYSYQAGHIPGSFNVPYGRWRTIWSDPLQLPSDADLTALIQTSGLSKDLPVVIVHSSAARGNFGSAAFVYWNLKSLGFPNIAILNGGIRGWKAEGFEMSQIDVPIVPSTETVTLDHTWLATHEDVTAVLNGTSDAQLLDARPIHQAMKDASLEGSVHFSALDMLSGEHAGAADEMDIFMQLKGADLAWQRGEVITYCNNGALAAVDWFMANEIAGIPNVKVYGHSLRARERAMSATGG